MVIILYTPGYNFFYTQLSGPAQSMSRNFKQSVTLECI
jgi:hypothetical protein